MLYNLKMAESVRKEASDEAAGNLECAVCLQSCVHPTELPCGHIFCYLCVKGIIDLGRRCAICRQDIPEDYLEKPRLLYPIDSEITSPGFEDGHLWFYEGQNGWWQYDERSSVELESAYQRGERCCDLLIAGSLYIADFDKMLQYRRNDPGKRRKIKRDLATTSKLGIAGIKTTKNGNITASNLSETAANAAVSEGLKDKIESLPVSNSPILSNLRIFNSGSDNSSQHTEIARNQIQRENSSIYCVCSCALATSSTAVSDTDNSSYIRNSSLDNALHDTLDQTIEQIESLNLELLNDYEALYRDVNNYERLQDNLNQSTFRTPNNSMSRYLNVTNPLRDLSLGSPASLEETNPVYSEETEAFIDRSSLEFDAQRPQPPPRSRAVSGMRGKLFLKKFTFNK